MPRQGICDGIENNIRNFANLTITGRRTGRGLRKFFETSKTIHELLNLNIDNLVKLGCDDNIQSLKEGI